LSYDLLEFRKEIGERNEIITIGKSLEANYPSAKHSREKSLTITSGLSPTHQLT
jgi:hypothetical protein